MDTFTARNRPSCSCYMCYCEKSDINPCIMHPSSRLMADMGMEAKYLA